MRKTLLFVLALVAAGRARAVTVPMVPENLKYLESVGTAAVPMGLVLEVSQPGAAQAPAPAPAAPVKKITKKEFDADIRNAKTLTVVYFYAEWCPTCKKVAGPVVEELAKQNAAVRFVKVDIDAEEDLAKEFKVASVPHFIAVKDGKSQELVLVLEVDEKTKRVTGAKLVPKP